MDEPDAIIGRIKSLIYDLRKARWVKPLVDSLCREFAGSHRPSARVLSDHILAQPVFLKAWEKGNVQLTEECFEARMAPAPGSPRTWKIPEITTLGDLADILNLHPDDLGWLISRGKTEHYHHCWHTKPKTNRLRLIEIPKTLLLDAQRRILRLILDPIPPHEAAQGFRQGCSVRDFVEPHTGKDIVVRIDLEDFFPSLGAARVLNFFLTTGYPESVSQALTRLTTHAVPKSVLASRPLTKSGHARLSLPHLPQGAPTSPALANLCAFRLDCRLTGLARAAGADYTRYADDLLFSGGAEFARQALRFKTKVGAIILEEGLHPNHRKTRVQRRGQRQVAAGLVINKKPNINRRELDQLKAILTNCKRSGPASQNRNAHPLFREFLQGKVAWVKFIHPGHGAKLERIFDQIDWEHESSPIIDVRSS